MGKGGKLDSKRARELGRLSGEARRRRAAEREVERARRGKVKGLDAGQLDETDRLAATYRHNPVGFFERLTNPETGERFVLYPAQLRFVREAFTLTPEGRLPYPELVYSAPKKSGKTTFAGMALLYIVRILGGRFAEGYALANDLDQSQGRVFTAAKRILAANEWLHYGGVEATANRIDFGATGGRIEALPSDYAGAAGGAPSVSCFDELWAYMSESAVRLWDEMVPVPNRPVSVRLTVTYAGFEGESALLEGLHKRGTAGEKIAPRLFRSDDLLCFWTHEAVAPWQTAEWVEQMRRQLRPSAFTRMVLNQFTAGESAFVPIEWWDRCVDPDLRPVPEDRELSVWVGLDGSVKRDSTALVAVTWDVEAGRPRLVRHVIFQPSPDDPLDFEATVEKTLLDWRKAYRIREVRFDPYQLIATAQRLKRAGLPMVEFSQTVPNLTEASTNLFDLIKDGMITVYRDPQIRRAMRHAVAIETARGC